MAKKKTQTFVAALARPIVRPDFNSINSKRRALKALGYVRGLPVGESVAISQSERYEYLGSPSSDPTSTWTYWHNLLTCVANGAPRAGLHKRYVANVAAVEELERELHALGMTTDEAKKILVEAQS